MNGLSDVRFPLQLELKTDDHRYSTWLFYFFLRRETETRKAGREICLCFILSHWGKWLTRSSQNKDAKENIQVIIACQIGIDSDQLPAKVSDKRVSRNKLRRNKWYAKKCSCSDNNIDDNRKPKYFFPEAQQISANNPLDFVSDSCAGATMARKKSSAEISRSRKITYLHLSQAWLAAFNFRH